MRAESGLEKSGDIIDDNKQRIRIDRFAILLRIDEEGVTSFIKESNDKPFMTTKIKQDFLKAQEQIQSSISNTKNQ